MATGTISHANLSIRESACRYLAFLRTQIPVSKLQELDTKFAATEEARLSEQTAAMLDIEANVPAAAQYKGNHARTQLHQSHQTHSLAHGDNGHGASRVASGGGVGGPQPRAPQQ
jgi:hypothetical protein